MSPLSTKSKYSSASSHETLDGIANNVYLLLFQRVLTLIGAPLIVYFVMDISTSFKEMSANIVDLRIEIARITTAVENNKDDIEELKGLYRGN